MTSTSPYQNNDYAAANSYRPYQLPINDIFKAVSAQSQFWDEGAAKVKNVYENALNLSLTIDENKQVRDKFMKDTEAQIVKLSSMNLADPSVQRKGVNLYKPLYDDEAIAIDNYLTKGKSAIFASAESYKSQKLDPKGRIGEGYNVDNLKDALDGFEELNASTTRDINKLKSLKTKLEGKKYEAYYDYSKDMREIAKECKGQTSQEANKIDLDGDVYIQTTLRSGSTAHGLRACLEYSLNDQAKNQINIEARRAYKNPDNTINYGAMAQAFDSRYTASVLTMTEQDTKLVASIAFNNKQYEDTKDKRYKDAADLSSKLRTNLLERIKNLGDDYSSIKTGDEDFLKENYDRLAGSIYKGSVMDGFSTAWNTESIKTAIKDDLHDLQTKKYQYLASIEKDKAATKEKDKGVDVNGNDLTPTNGVGAYKTEDLLVNGTVKMQEEIDVAYKNNTDNTKEFYENQVQEQWTAQGKKEEDFYDPKSGILTPAGQKYMDEALANNSKSAIAYQSRAEEINNEIAVNTAVKKYVDNNPEVLKLTEDWSKKLLDKKEFPDYKDKNGTITAQQIQDAILGKNSPLTIKKEKLSVPGISEYGNIKKSTILINTKYFINGNEIEVTYGTPGNVFLQLANKVSEGNIINNNEALKKKNELYGKILLAKEGRVLAEERNLDPKDEIRSNVYTLAVKAGYEGKMEDIRLISRNPKTGMGSFAIPKPAGKDKIVTDKENFLASVQTNQGAKSSIYGSDDNTLIVDIPYPNLVSEEYKSSKSIPLIDNLSRMGEAIENSSHLPIGRRDKDNALVFESKIAGNTSYKVIPYKNKEGKARWDLYVQEKTGTDKGQYKKTDDEGLDINQIIQRINN